LAPYCDSHPMITLVRPNNKAEQSDEMCDLPTIVLRQKKLLPNG